MRIEWLDAALDDVEAISDYIARDNLTAAARVERHIREAIALLAAQPGIGRPGRVGRTRELIVRPYIVPYHVRGQVIEVLAVIDGRRGAIDDLTLSARDSRIFVDALLNPTGPNDALQAAFADYKEFTGQR